MSASVWLTSWRDYLFGTDADIDYDTFVTAPRRRHAVPCRVCGSLCDVRRSMVSSSPEGDVPMLIDRFTCRYRAHAWHRQARALVTEMEASDGSELRTLWSDLDEILRRHRMPERLDQATTVSASRGSR